jgi:glycosyltransferase involved in cell wall biosynthesis
MNRVAFLTTVYPMDVEYLKDMFDSLVKQTYKAFDIVVVNDGLEEFSSFKKNYNDKLNIIELISSNSPAKNRQFGINYCIEKGYKFLVFGDSDDYFFENRVEKSIEFLTLWDIVVNDLSLFDENGICEDMYITNRLRNGSVIDFDFIRNKNIFGLSNTAITLKKIEPIDIPEDLIAVDWYFFSFLLLNGMKAIFTNETITYYRQYNRNLVGLKELDKESYERGVKVKKLHYKALQNLTNKVEDYAQYFSENNVCTFEEREIAYPIWWELI